MAVTSAATGTQTASIGTEHTLFDTTAAGTYNVSVDTSQMASVDVLELRVYEMAKAGGTRQVLYVQTVFAAASGDPVIWASIPASTSLTDSGALRFTLKQTVGTGRTYDYTVRKFA